MEPKKMDSRRSRPMSQSQKSSMQLGVRQHREKQFICRFVRARQNRIVILSAANTSRSGVLAESKERMPLCPTANVSGSFHDAAEGERLESPRERARVQGSFDSVRPALRAGRTPLRMT